MDTDMTAAAPLLATAGPPALSIFPALPGPAALPGPPALAGPAALTGPPAAVTAASEALLSLVADAEARVVEAEATAASQLVASQAQVEKAQADVRRAYAEIARSQQSKTFSAAEYPLLHGIPQGVYGAILVDPPFRYGRQVGSGVADNHYTTMDEKVMAAMDVKGLSTKNALLFMWCSGPTMHRAIELCEDWGFKYKTVASVWVKTNKSGKPQSMGLGHYTRPGAEYLLVAGRNSGASLVLERPDQVFFAPRRAHSQKPDETRTMIDKMIGDEVRKIELFSRCGDNPQWDVWGDETDKVLE